MNPPCAGREARYRHAMRKLVLAVMLGIVPLQAMAAEPRAARKKVPSAVTAKPKAAKANPCAEYGAGFVPIEGSSTCIRIGGSIGVGAGMGR